MTTIKDIANATGYSITTVSRALNGYDDVNVDTKEKIVKMAKQLNYAPNVIARSLVMKKTKTLGVLIDGLSKKNVQDLFVYPILCGINDYLRSCDYEMIIFSVDSERYQNKSYKQICMEKQVEGIITSGLSVDDKYLKEVLESTKIPTVLIDIPLKTKNVGFVSIDHLLAAKNAVKYLIQLDHKNIAMVNGYEKAYVSNERFLGYQEALYDNNITFKKEYVVNGRFQEDIAKDETIKLLLNYPEISAIFCSSDLMAIGVLKAAKELNLLLPDQLSVIGFDDIILTSYTTPTLTTVSQSGYDIGFQAAKLMIDMIHHRAEDLSIIIDHKLIIRNSTKKK